MYVKEDYPQKAPGGEEVPVDTSRPNPNQIEFDNLYLDMNGIIHPASHPEEGPVPETEDDMFIAIMEYLDRVFACVRPRKVLYMAIDGVAPRAKMNQQRARRFRSAQERQEGIDAAEELRAKLRAEGVDVPDAPEEPPFDSNVITPGTPFMAALAEHLRHFIRKKLDGDPGWRGLKVIFSDAAVPGEGEHKLMEYIRLQRCTPGYDPNTKHVIHGLDADLIMLGLATHDPHFWILREEVTAGGSEKKVSKADVMNVGQPQAEPELLGRFAKPFQFVQLSVLREYLTVEFGRHVDYTVSKLTKVLTSSTQPPPPLSLMCFVAQQILLSMLHSLFVLRVSFPLAPLLASGFFLLFLPFLVPDVQSISMQ